MPIRFGTYNIRNRRNGGLESSLRGMYQANMDLRIFQDTKCTDRIYTRESAGYRVVATDAPNDTATEWHYSIDRPQFLRWRLSESTGQTS